MCKFNPKNDGRRMDPCMKNIINFMQVKGGKIQPLSCCCGHGKYPMTIVVTNRKVNWELVSNKIIPRKKRFYKKDKQGYYYIPETIKPNQRICECSHKEWDEHKCSFEPMVAQECNVKGCKCKKFKIRKRDK